MGIIRKLFRAEPQPTEDGAYSPSPLALRLATSARTNFDGGDYPKPYRGDDKRILVVCTEQRNMTMANGKLFSTGNHPVEMGLPILHLRKAGFEVDFVTPTGAPAQIEDWAMPRQDDAVMTLFDELRPKLKTPGSLADFVAGPMQSDPRYIGIFIPGGHGAMLGLPTNPDLKALLHWAVSQDKFILTICHGPAALLAAEGDGKFLFDGKRIAAFPDAVDRQTPMIGYMPGHMPWFYGAKLEALGVTIINSKADDSCHADGKLITGASPQAANTFGRLCATTLLQAVG